MNTITIERKTTQTHSTALSLPFYGIEHITSTITRYWAITGEVRNLAVTIYSHSDEILPSIFSRSANDMPAEVEQVSESVFMAAYSKAIHDIEDAFLAACPNATAPQVTLQNA